MSYGVAVNTQIAGAAQGNFLDDLTTLGQWPRPNTIRRIIKIVVYAGNIIDSVRITYETIGAPATVTHGGAGGQESLSFELDVNQTITAVYGRRLNNSSPYGSKNIVQLSFVVATKDTDASGNPPKLSLQTVSAAFVKEPNTQFQFTWPLVGATSYAAQPSGEPNSYLQGLGFTELFSQAGGPL